MEVFKIPRSPRQKSITKVYHIILRGINRQDIFLDKQDFRKFLKEIQRTKEVYKYEVYAYALMPNHIHFIIYDVNDNLASTIKSITVAYSYYFNKKYERSGHLFENRFKSKIIEEESYMKNLVRYIHKNPQNAGLRNYFWTSYIEYVNQEENIISKNFIMNLFNNNIQNFKSFHNDYDKSEDFGKEYELISKLQDDEAIKIMKEISQEENLMKIQNYEVDNKNKIIYDFIRIEGITRIQISRILGISKKTIERIEKRMSQKGHLSHRKTSPSGQGGKDG